MPATSTVVHNGREQASNAIGDALRAVERAGGMVRKFGEQMTANDVRIARRRITEAHAALDSLSAAVDYWPGN